MPSERQTVSVRLAEGLLSELASRGIRGAYARRLVSEWTDHFHNLTETMPVTEALVRLGSPADLAQAASESRFGGRWWWRFPATAGVFWGLLAYVTAMAWVCIPVMASLCGWTSMTEFSWYAPAYNWAGPAIVFLSVWWLSGKVSSPPRFRKCMLGVLAALLALSVMEIQIPEGYVPGSGAGSFSVAVMAGPAPDFRMENLISSLVFCRVGLVLGLFFLFRRRPAAIA